MADALTEYERDQKRIDPATLDSIKTHYAAGGVTGVFATACMLDHIDAQEDELKELRAMRKRLEEWATMIESKTEFGGSGEWLAAELRRRIEGP